MRALVLVLLSVLAAPLAAQDGLRIAIKSAPPFAFQSADAPGGWTGFAVELWNEVASRAPVFSGPARFVDAPTADAVLELVERRDADVAIGALTITSEREEVVDFAHAFLASGLGIATSASGGGGLMAILSRVFSWNLLKAIGALAVVLLAFGGLVWLVERRRNEQDFGGTSVQGLGSAFWWSAVTMTTVGYGDKAPKTVAGRVIALVWMFASIVIISSYTASIASALTVGELSSRIDSPDALRRVRIASVDGSAGAAWLDEQGFRHRGYGDAERAVTALASGEVDAVVHDRPLLHYLVAQQPGSGLVVLPYILRAESYGFALGSGDVRREELSRAILEVQDTPRYAELERKYLGGE